jgi:2,4-dienoyl-CoA reductase-like NADH-dependent reductase (Old Yellow Enzyme family)
MVFATMPMGSPQGCFVHLSHNIKKHVNIPIIAIGRIKDPILAGQIIDEGKADIIAMGRALICDPQLPRKAHEGKLEKIRPCIGCLECVTRIADMLPIICTVNPSLGKEDKDFVKKPRPKKFSFLEEGPAA